MHATVELGLEPVTEPELRKGEQPVEEVWEEAWEEKWAGGRGQGAGGRGQASSGDLRGIILDACRSARIQAAPSRGVAFRL